MMDLFWYIQVSFRTCGSFIGLSWCMLVTFGIYRSVFVYVGLFYRLLLVDPGLSSYM